MSSTTSRLGYPYPQPSDPNNVPADMQRLASALDLNVTAFSQGTDGNRPASTSTSAGRLYYATDTTKLYYDLGGSWIVVNAANTTVTTKGDVLVASGNAALARLAAGTDGQALVARSTAANGVDWESQLGMPLALAGVPSATRYVGGITDPQSPPQTGSFQVGDAVVCQTGQILVCTTAGSGGAAGWRTDGVIVPTDTTKPGNTPGDLRYVASSPWPLQVWQGASAGWVPPVPIAGVCRVKLNANVGMSGGSDVFASANWIVGEDPDNIATLASSFPTQSYLTVQYTGRYIVQVRAVFTNPASSGTCVAYVMRGAANINNSIMRANANTANAGGDGTIVQGSRSMILNSGDVLYWGHWSSVNSTLVPTQYTVPTEISITMVGTR